MKVSGTFKFKVNRNPVLIPLPSLPPFGAPEAQEELTGMVDGLQASAPEERLAKQLNKAQIQYQFRYTVGAPRGLPGWKEVDFVILTNGITYALEVDTAFTHRDKAQKDVLHDAIVQNDPYINSLGTLWPTVIHANGETELADDDSTRAYVKKLFGK